MPDGFPGFGQPRPVRFRPCAGGFCGSLREQGGRGRDRAPVFTFAVPRRTSGKSGSGNSAFCRADGRRTCGARFLPDMRRTENPRGFEIRSEPLSLPPKRVGKIHENIQDTFDERFARGGRSDSRRAGRPHGDRVSRRDGRGQDDADPGGLRPPRRDRHGDQPYVRYRQRVSRRRHASGLSFRLLPDRPDRGGVRLRLRGVFFQRKPLLGRVAREDREPAPGRCDERAHRRARRG